MVYCMVVYDRLWYMVYCMMVYGMWWCMSIWCTVYLVVMDLSCPWVRWGWAHWRCFLLVSSRLFITTRSIHPSRFVNVGPHLIIVLLWMNLFLLFIYYYWTLNTSLVKWFYRNVPLLMASTSPLGTTWSWLCSKWIILREAPMRWYIYIYIYIVH